MLGARARPSQLGLRAERCQQRAAASPFRSGRRSCATHAVSHTPLLSRQCRRRWRLPARQHSVAPCLESPHCKAYPPAHAACPAAWAAARDLTQQAANTARPAPHVIAGGAPSGSLGGGARAKGGFLLAYCQPNLRWLVVINDQPSCGRSAVHARPLVLAGTARVPAASAGFHLGATAPSTRKQHLAAMAQLMCFARTFTALSIHTDLAHLGPCNAKRCDAPCLYVHGADCARPAYAAMLEAWGTAFFWRELWCWLALASVRRCPCLCGTSYACLVELLLAAEL